MNLYQPTPRILSVLVREDVAADYGGDIRTASDYKSLLQWLKAQNPEAIPGMAAVTPFTNLPLSLFLPEAGYWTETDSSFVAISIDTRVVIPTHTLPQARAAFEELFDWWRESLLHVQYWVTPDDRVVRRYSEFQTVLMYADEFTDPPAYARLIGLPDFDARSYRMYTLYSGEGPRMAWTGGRLESAQSLAAAGLYADTSEFYRLLERLEYNDNYIWLFYGEEGTDYERIDGRIAPLEADRAQMRTALTDFTRMDCPIIPVNAPLGYEAALAAWSPAYELAVTDEDNNTLKAWWLDWTSRPGGILAAVSAENQANALDYLFHVGPPPEAELVAECLDRFYVLQDKHMELIIHWAGLVQAAIGRAEIEWIGRGA